jgi:hypothetical protein
MNHDEKHLFAVTEKVMQALHDLAHEDVGDLDEFKEDEVLTCLQLAAEQVAFDCFDVHIGTVSEQTLSRFREHLTSGPEPTPRAAA